MKYEYTVARGSRVYHIRKPGLIYTLCGHPPGRGAKVYTEPPPKKRICRQCAAKQVNPPDSSGTGR